VSVVPDAAALTGIKVAGPPPGHARGIRKEPDMTQLNNPQAQSLMTRSVVTVLPTTQVREIAQILCERGISAVPVVDATGRVLGLVTEADLIRRLAGLDDAPLGWLGGLFADPAKRAERYARTHGMVAEDIMTQNVVSVAGNTPASAIAQLMEQNNIRRVLVIDGGQLAGIVSRADLLHALTMPQEEAPGLVDEHIRQAVMEAMRRESWSNGYYTTVGVRGGVVTFEGFRQDGGTSRGMHVLALSVSGVRGVVDNTTLMPVAFMAGV